MRSYPKIILILFLSVLVFNSCSQKINVARNHPDEINRVPSFASNSPDMIPSTYGERIHEGLILYRSGKYIKAQNYFKAVIKDYPKEWSVHYYLGLVYCKLDNCKNALREYDTGLDYAPDDPKVLSSVYRAIAECFEHQDNFNKAEKNFRIALDLFPESTSARRGLDRIYQTRQNMR